MREYINIINESVMINEAWQQLPVDVRNDVETIIAELNKLEEAELQPAQIQSVFQKIADTRNSDMMQAGPAMKKVAGLITPIFTKITSNPKLNSILSKVGNAVPMDKLQKLVAGLPEPAGSKASAVVSSIKNGASQIKNDEDLAAFKGLMITIITIGMGVAGAGGPAVLGVISSAALFRTVVDSAITAAAGGSVADIGKDAGVGFVAGAIAGSIGLGISELASEVFPDETITEIIPLKSNGEINLNDLEAMSATSIDNLNQESARELLDTARVFSQLEANMDKIDEVGQKAISDASDFLDAKIEELGGTEALQQQFDLEGTQDLSRSGYVDGPDGVEEIEMEPISAESLANAGINLDNAPPLNDTIVQNLYKLGEQYDASAKDIQEVVRAMEINQYMNNIEYEGKIFSAMSSMGTLDGAAQEATKTIAEYGIDLGDSVVEIAGEGRADISFNAVKAQLPGLDEEYSVGFSMLVTNDETGLTSTMSGWKGAVTETPMWYQKAYDDLLDKAKSQGIKYSHIEDMFQQNRIDIAARSGWEREAKDLVWEPAKVKKQLENSVKKYVEAAAVPIAVAAMGTADENIKNQFVQGAQEQKESMQFNNEWTIALTEEVGEDFVQLTEDLGPELAVFVMLEWYNSWIKENTIILEGFEHLQEHRLIEDTSKALAEGPMDIAKKIGGAYRKATGAVGGAVAKGAKAVGGAVSAGMSALLKPVMGSPAIQNFLNQVKKLTGSQGALDIEKLQSDYQASGSPTDSEEVKAFLVKSGVTKQEIEKSFQDIKLDAPAQPQQPDVQQDAQPQQPDIADLQKRAGIQQPQQATKQHGSQLGQQEEDPQQAQQQRQQQQRQQPTQPAPSYRRYAT